MEFARAAGLDETDVAQEFARQPIGLSSATPERSREEYWCARNLIALGSLGAGLRTITDEGTSGQVVAFTRTPVHER